MAWAGEISRSAWRGTIYAEASVDALMSGGTKCDTWWTSIFLSPVSSLATRWWISCVTVHGDREGSRAIHARVACGYEVTWVQFDQSITTITSQSWNAAPSSCPT